MGLKSRVESYIFPKKGQGREKMKRREGEREKRGNLRGVFMEGASDAGR